MKLHRILLAAALAALMLPASVSAKSLRPTNPSFEPGRSYWFIDRSVAVNDFTEAVYTCDSMTVDWDQMGSATLSAYLVDYDDDTAAEIELAPLVDSFTTDVSDYALNVTGVGVRFVVDAAETNAFASTLVVTCLPSSGGGIATATTTLCSAETGTGVCDAASVDLRANVSTKQLLTFSTDGSTGNYRCLIYQDSTVITTADVDLSNNGAQATSYDLSNRSQESVTLLAGFGTVWISCPENTGTVTATVRAQG